jgi:NADH-quinone oxidoreductase subunit C
MDNQAIAKYVQGALPDCSVQQEEHFGQLTLVIGRAAVVPLLRFLRDDPSMAFNFLMDLFGVDYLEMAGPERFAVIYNLYSMSHGHRLRVKAFIPENDPAVDSVTSLYPSADWPERETYDMYGIQFTGHPNLRRILDPEDFVGHPLRKEFPVTGIGYRDQFEKIERSNAQ